MIELRTSVIASTALAGVAVFSPSGLSAASDSLATPQALGLVATFAPQPVTCRGEICSAVLTSFCLQEERPEPRQGTRYAPASGGAVTLVGVGPGGERVSVDIRDAARFQTNFTVASVRVEFDRVELLRAGVSEAALSVGRGVTLLPAEVVAGKGDMTEEEIARAVGADRALARRFFDDGGVSAKAAQLTAAMISRLPEKGRATPRMSRDILLRAIPAALAEAAGPDALARARESVSVCETRVAQGRSHTLRHCLEMRHSQAVIESNTDFWNAPRRLW